TGLDPGPSLDLPVRPQWHLPPAAGPSLAVPLGKLRSFLASEEVQYADILTTSLLLEATGRLSSGWLRRRDAERLSFELLASIDASWAEFSHGMHGFRAQLSRHREPPRGAPPGRAGDFYALALALGWKRTSSATMPRYSEFVEPPDRGAGFFPTLRNPQL